MERVVWGVLVSFIITVSVGVCIVWLNIENNSKILQEQRESIAENRVQLELIRDLLSKMQQQQMNETNILSEFQKPIEFNLLRKMQQEIANQGKEIANDREKLADWMEELQTSIRTKQNETANSLMDVLQDIATNRASQDESIKLLNSLQQEIQQHKRDETNWHTESQQAITEMQKQWKDIASDRVKVSKWQQEVQTSIRTYENRTAYDLKDILRDIATNRALQEQSIELLQQDMQKSQEVIADDRVEQEQNRKSIDDLSKIISELKSELSTQRQEANKNRNETFKSIEQLERDHKQIRSILNIHPGSYRSCKDVQTKASGTYNIREKDIFNTFVASCEQDKHDGGWMVIQHRFDGSLSFNRNWTDYRNGFGEVDGEHWLGLEHIHQFTKEHDCELLVEMKDFFNNSKYARYSSFGIGSEAEQYRLTTLGTHSGTAGDSLQFHKGMKFSTPDSDNDNKAEGNCAKTWSGGWWFNQCYHADMNGVYRNASGIKEDNIAWYGFNDDWRGLSFSRMLVRPLY
ncbi:fibrinogen-like protein 1 [Anopheles aquasalis]|uniref:fibrinogen-like protein 1 n=1 Tax=Anopheles aquasalis TaxID=42839 RepID=UPI00215B2A67|nr:fibrinogen-like protein 1 [Anopheles aquasalis]